MDNKTEEGEFIHYFNRKRMKSNTEIISQSSMISKPSDETKILGHSVETPVDGAGSSTLLSPQTLANMSPRKIAQITMLPTLVRQSPVTTAWIALETNGLSSKQKISGPGAQKMPPELHSNFNVESIGTSNGRYTDTAQGTIISTSSNAVPAIASTNNLMQKPLEEINPEDNQSEFKNVSRKNRDEGEIRPKSEWNDPTNPNNRIPMARIPPRSSYVIQIPFDLRTAIDRIQYYQKTSSYEPRTWKSFPEIMMTDEAMDRTQDWQEIDPETNQVILYPNVPNGSFGSTEEYLKVQYELFREEAVRPIREAVAVARQYPDGEELGNFGIYENVRVTGLTMSRRGIGMEISFSTRRAGKKIQWELSTRLMTSSVVALSSDNFQNECIIAVVASHDLDKLNLSPPKTDLFFSDPQTLEVDPLKHYVMVEERTGFFEAQRHVMVSLQRMSVERFPLQNMIVHCKMKCNEATKPPKYILDDPMFNMSEIYGKGYERVNILEPISFDHDKAMLDKWQSDALQHIFSRQLAIVQGPPGTGKTFVSIVAIKLLLQRWKRGDPPIIIACQTNHALDQLLRHIATFEERFARLGGRSKDHKVIKPRTMYELRRTFGKRSMRGTVGVIARNLELFGVAIRRELCDIAVDENANEDFINHETLFNHKLISDKQFESFVDGDTEFLGKIETEEYSNPLLEWLGSSAAKVSKIGLDQFVELEEETKLEPEEIKEREAEALTDESEQLQGHYIPINQHIQGRGLEMAENQAINILKEQNVWRIPQRLRGSLYNYFVGKLKRILRQNLCAKAVEYNKEVERFKFSRWESDLEILLEQKVIGMTTTGLNKYRGLVQALSPRVFIIEEAAEVLEAPVVAGACIDTLQHLILVGDHMQLRPSCIVHDLRGEPFYLDTSLFERMVENGLGFRMLRTQRRMIPEIRKLLYPIYGDKIHDHKSVHERPKDIPGVNINTYMWVHREPEHKDETMSTANLPEAEMLIGFCTYLLANGVKAKKISILTFYQAQRKLIEQLIRKQAREYSLRTTPISLEGINIATVDSYQGEENDIVLLSLVRSNERRILGFSGIANRICVALSRARIGLYIFGNIHLFADNSREWNEVYSLLSDDTETHVGYELPLKCVRHGNLTYIRDARDWQRMNNGGCDRACAFELPCGHACADRCHPGDHENYQCHRQCSKIIEKCRHRCQLACHEECICLTCNPNVVLHEADLREKVDALGSVAVASAMAAKYGINKIVIPQTELSMRGPPPGLENVLAPVLGPGPRQAFTTDPQITQSLKQKDLFRQPIENLPVLPNTSMNLALRKSRQQAQAITKASELVPVESQLPMVNSPITTWENVWGFQPIKQKSNLHQEETSGQNNSHGRTVQRPHLFDGEDMGYGAGKVKKKQLEDEQSLIDY